MRTPVHARFYRAKNLSFTFKLVHTVQAAEPENTSTVDVHAQ